MSRKECITVSKLFPWFCSPNLDLNVKSFSYFNSEVSRVSSTSRLRHFSHFFLNSFSKASFQKPGSLLPSKTFLNIIFSICILTSSESAITSSILDMRSRSLACRLVADWRTRCLDVIIHVHFMQVFVHKSSYGCFGRVIVFEQYCSRSK